MSRNQRHQGFIQDMGNQRNRLNYTSGKGFSFFHQMCRRIHNRVTVQNKGLYGIGQRKAQLS